ncbi:ATP-binding protein [Pigmentiphaga sp. YJ18]|uniref:ATP-binding protein n=1 Tax=Alcaligenaceae TaxID=506 RepID=UPI0006C3E50E|nr:ATP-binding protein [Achromobacter xylosoxidans]CUI84606.1 Divergent AAA domain [Achromobacter xylosoxidans]
MTQPDLSQRLDSLVATWENEVVEFKQAGDNYSTDDIGKYFSALANEANLRGSDGDWLVFGVNNKTRRAVGTDYRLQSERLHSLKMQVAENAEPRITFREIHELEHTDGRVLMFEISAAPQGIPIAWKGDYYARAGESLVSLGLDSSLLTRLRRRGVIVNTGSDTALARG